MMDDMLHRALAGWSNFYMITGTAAAALTGLQFVVQTLIASGDARRAVEGTDAEESIAAFGTPTVVHFSLALLLSALLSVPWPGERSLRATLGVVGASALLYSIVVLRRARQQEGYAPVVEDWVWHVVLPGLAYAAVVVAAALFEGDTVDALFSVGAATLILICVGIHNAWDTVIYLTLSALRQAEDAGPVDDDAIEAPVANGARNPK